MPCLLVAQAPFENPLILDVNNGLPHNRINSIAEDENGVAWIATRKGLVRFDGMTLETYLSNSADPTALPHHNIYKILPDVKNGKVWIGNQRGLSVFDIEKKLFKNYSNEPDDPFSFPDHQCLSVFKDKDNQIWAGVRSNGIVKYRPETDDFEQFLCNGENDLSGEQACHFSANEICADPVNDSILWLAGHGITRFNRINGHFENFYHENSDPKKKRYLNIINCTLIHSNGKIYYGTWHFGVYVFDIPTHTISPLNPCFENGSAPFEDETVFNFFQVNGDEFWINSQRGTRLYNVRTGCITQSFTNDKYKQRWYSVDHIDSKNRIWSIFGNRGLHIYNPLMRQHDFFQYEPSGSPYSPHTSSVVEDTVLQRVYVGSIASKGLHFFDKISGEWNYIQPPAGYKNGDINDFTITGIAPLENSGLLVIGGADKIYWYKPGFKRLQLYPVQAKEKLAGYRACLRDSEGNIWLGGWRNGFHRLNPKTQELHSFEEQLKAYSDVQLAGDYMAEDKNGNIWMRENNGLLIYEKATGNFIYHPYDPKNLKAYRGMGKMEADDQGRVWIATQKEWLGYGHADSLDRGVIRFLGRKEGLIGSFVFLPKVHQNKILVFTDKGMQEFDPNTMRFGKLYDAEYGLGESVSVATWLSDGQLAVGREKAIALFHPDSLNTNEELPLPYINSFRVFDDVYYLKSGPRQKDSIHLSYKQNFFSFEFSAIGYNLPEKTQFRYQLEGFDEKWQDGTKRRFAAYTNVPGGDYTFKVQAINSEGLSLADPHVLFIHVSTVWYKTVWFWCLALVLSAAIAYATYKWRIAQVRKEERIKSEYERKLADVEMTALRAQMNPHFIFNSLNSIDYYIISNEQEKASDYLNRFSRLIRLILQNSKSSIVPLKDDLEALRLYIEMESMRFDNLFDYEVKMESGIQPEKIVVPPMLFQPYVENAIWHGLMQKKGERGKLDLTIRRSNGHLVCLIEDNGIGRDAAKQLKSKSATRRKSYGMKITSDRLAMLNKLAGANASVSIFDLKNGEGKAAGTRVELVIPI